MFVLAALASAALGAWPFDRSDGQRAERAYAEALRVAGGDESHGALALARFLEDFPRSALADDAALRLAQLEQSTAAYESAEQRLVWALREHARGDQSERVRLLLAQLLVRRGVFDEAYRTAGAIAFDRLELRERREAHRLLADTAAMRGDTPAQLRWLAQLLADRLGAAEQRATREQIDAAVDALAPERLEQSAEAIGPHPPAAQLYLRAAELALAAADGSRAQTLVKAARRVPLLKDDAQRLVQLEQRLAAGAVLANDPAPEAAAAVPQAGGAGLRATLGVVLPLSGAYASFGEETLQGILLATGILSAAEEPNRLRLLVRDSAGTAAGATAALEALAADPSLIAVFGPLLPEEQDAAARAANASGVPLLTFSRREGASDAYANVLQLAAPIRAEAQLVAEYAVETLGVRRFAILYPASAAGRQLRADFWDALDAAGGQVVAVAGYEANTADFSAPIRKLTGFGFVSAAAHAVLREKAALRKRAKRLPPAEATALLERAAALQPADGSPLPPFVDFDALFIADVHDRAGLIAPHLAFQDVRGVRLLGTSTWHQHGLVGIGGSHVEGAVFATRYHGEREEPSVARFEQRFREGFGRAPSYLAAQAFDAVNFALLAIARGYSARESFADGLRVVGAWHGVAGDLRFLPDGRLAHRPGLAAVTGGRIVPLDSNLAPGDVPTAAPAASPENDALAH